MKDKLLKILKISLIALIAIIIVLLVFWLVLSLDWPLWVGFFLLLALVGIIIGVVYLRKLWLKRREKKFVQQVIAQDEAKMKAVQGKERDELKDLQDSWKEAVDALRRSHIKKFGDPLYVLPWYLIIGESGSGKTTSIKSARLSSPFVEVKHTSGVSGTRNCDWWFFEQAIIIDTAGRYAMPVDEGKDQAEWQSFLNLLVKYRNKEPLNGLIVTVAANKLLEGTAESLEEDGKIIRRRIDELMRVLGIKFPVYVLVTKCDLIQGMTQFCDHLPEESAGQAMGVMNMDKSKDIDAFLKRAMNTVGERLRSLRILLLHKPEAGGLDPRLLLFPEEFENLTRGIESFMKGAFLENPFQDTPVLRGLFFSSGRQEGSPYSHFLSTLGLIGEKEVLPGTSRGLFLHDFFSKILPRDRGMFAQTSSAREWQTLTRNLGFISWIVTGIAICGLLSFSSFMNLRTIRGASREITEPPVLQREFIPDLISMNRFNNAIVKVEERNRNWWFPRFGLNESINVEKGLKEKFCSQYRDDFLKPMDKQMKGKAIRNLSGNTPDEDISQYIMHLVRRINLLKARLDDKDIESIKTMPQPSYVSLLSTVGEDIGSEERQTFGQLYFHYTVWRPDIDEIKREITDLQIPLNRLLKFKAPEHHWIVTWINREGSVAPVALGDFWGGKQAAQDEITIAPAFTLNGNKSIASIIKEVESALSDPQDFQFRKKEFDIWYSEKTFEAWHAFASAFPGGKDRMKGREEWKKTASKISTYKGPYFAFINKIVSDLGPLVEEISEPPSWIKHIFRFQSATKAAEKGKNFISSIKNKLGKDESETSAFRKYRETLDSMTAASDSSKQAYKMASIAFTEDQAVSQSPVYEADRAVAALKSSLNEEGIPDMVWKLIIGPFDYLWEYTLMETACTLQSQWEEEALAGIQGASNDQVAELLLGANGSAWKFIEGPAKPFIEFSPEKGRQARKVLGREVPFNSSFFAFLESGNVAHADGITRQSYNVQISGLPTDYNSDAVRKPQATHLELQCADNKTFSLDNYHFKDTKTFNWSPQNCNDVTLKIDIGSFVLTKSYKGKKAFVKFLEDFKEGQYIFFPKDFPERQTDLENLEVKYITVYYEFTGATEILNKFKSGSDDLLRSIAECRDK